MDDPKSKNRHSVPLIPDLITDPDDRAEREVANGRRQIATVLDLVDAAVSPDRPFKFRPSTILQLHRIALDGISAYAGNFRPSDIEIEGSGNKPPPAHLVPELFEELCDYVNANFEKSAIHLAAYVNVAPELDSWIYRWEWAHLSCRVILDPVRSSWVKFARRKVYSRTDRGKQAILLRCS